MLSGLRNFMLTFLISALIFGILASLIIGFVLDTVDSTIPAGNGITNETAPDGQYNPNHDNNNPSKNNSPDDTDISDLVVDEIEGETFNILLIGNDYQPELFDDYDYEEKWEGEGFPDKRNRPWGADMIILLRVDKENRQFIFTSIPRNSRVYVDGAYVQLGDTLGTKGLDYLCGKVASMTGLRIDYYASVSVSAIEEAIDAVGTVTYYVPEDMQYSDPLQNLEIDLEKGTTTIDGEKAAQLLRYVGYKNGNTGRMNTTIEFAKAILAKFTNVTYLDKADDLYNAVSKHAETNFTLDDLLNNLDLIFAYSKFETVTITYPGSNKVYDGITYFEPKIANAIQIFDSYK
ncbi:MAG: LCP family protein [Clostridia bacterium]|nr:LCP family protein [Clostridia bacterium]